LFSWQKHQSLQDFLQPINSNNREILFCRKAFILEWQKLVNFKILGIIFEICTVWEQKLALWVERDRTWSWAGRCEHASSASRRDTAAPVSRPLQSDHVQPVVAAWCSPSRDITHTHTASTDDSMIATTRTLWRQLLPYGYGYKASCVTCLRLSRHL